ncbi:hypothetical protein [Kitasatospora sp. NPDC098663]|uniref:hypothetical protein n=1 Tax=Kitasatospora sp. NPDC098663 TaxID=3364096 RepID=UPI0037F26B9E
MAAPASTRTVQTAWFKPAWLPPGGHGNGLPAPTWAPIADLDTRIVDELLLALADADVPAYTAPAPRPVRPLLPGDGTRTVGRLWVGFTSYAKAELVLVTCMPPLLRGIEQPRYPVPHRYPRHPRKAHRW